MAQEEIKLVGKFEDKITKDLQKLNREIANLSRSFERFNKKLAPVTKSFAKLALSAKGFGDAMKNQRQTLDNTVSSMRQYRTEARKMASSIRKVADANQAAQRARGVSRSQARAGKGSDAGMGGPVTTAKGTSRAGAAMGQSFMKNIASTAIGVGIANAFMRGVSSAKNMLFAPFSKFGSMFKERIGDEMDDIKSAGGLFALDMDLTAQSGNERFFKNYNEALRFQEKLNIDMAESAASLPGVTSQYVATSRQLTDTIQMVMEKDREGFNKLAEQYGANVSGGGVDASKEAMRTVLQKQTEQVMLQSQGQTGGLPMHIAIQQLLGMEQGKIKMQAFTNKFRAAFQKNPLLKNFLLRAEGEMNKTAAGSADRLRILMETFDRAMPKQVVNKMRGSISGMQEALRSGLLDPQAGLFGMSRANIDPATGKTILKKNVDDFGDILYKITEDIGIDANFAKQLKGLGIEKAAGDTLKGVELTAKQLTALGYSLDKAGNILGKQGQQIGEISTSSTYIFEQIREILAGYGPVLLEFVGYLPALFDPFGAMTKSLGDFRDRAQTFILGFNNKLDEVEEVAQNFASMDDSAKKGLGALLKNQSRGRAAFSQVADVLKGLGGIDDALYDRVQDITGDMTEAGIKAVDEGAMNSLVSELIMSVVNSDLMKEFGKIGGLIIGGITKAMVDVIKGVTGLAKGDFGNKLMDGFAEGFTDAFGDMGMGEVMGVITDALNAIIIQIGNWIINPGLPLLFTGIFEGIKGLLMSGDIIGIILGGLALWKVITVIGTVVSVITTVITTITSVISFIAGAWTVISGIIGVVATTILAPVLAFAGAVMIAIAIVRNFGSIMQMVGGVFKMVAGLIVSDFSKVFGALGTVLSWIPGVRKVGEAMKKGGEAMLGFGRGLKEEGLNDVKEAASNMKKQFEEDTGKIKEFVTGMNPATTAMGEFVGATNDATAAQKEAAKATIKRFDGDTRVALLKAGVSGTQIEAMETRQTEIDEQLAKLRGGNVHDAPPALTEPVQNMDDQAAEVAKVGTAASQTAPKLDATTKAAESATSALDSATSAIETIPPKVETALVGAATSAGNAITQAAQELARALNSAAQSIKSAASASSGANLDVAGAESKFDGKGGKMMPLGDAIATERKNMPSGANLVIANSSETVIPAFSGHMGDGFKGFSFAEMESAAGFNRMASYTDQIAEIADRTAAQFSMGGILGGGSATLNAMEALGNANGLITTSGFRPGDPGFHGANRARDLSNGSGETPEMNKVANIMASNFGQSLTELIYTPLGFSIKNGQKTGLISPDNHYHHIHVAVAEGLQKAAVFSSQKAAESYERRMMPAGAEPLKVNLGSMTANTSEMGAGGITVGEIHVHGVDDPKEIANVVAGEILDAVQRATYSELFTS